ncbi:hypothetical protein H4R33_002953 [Dimargaris cristalligena]|nr:hypothetical protein H4R33_002953 [Dimargaris cristalligena]
MKVHAALFLAASAAVVLLATPSTAAPFEKLLDNVVCINANLANSGSPPGGSKACSESSSAAPETGLYEDTDSPSDGESAELTDSKGPIDEAASDTPSELTDDSNETAELEQVPTAGNDDDDDDDDSNSNKSMTVGPSRLNTTPPMPHDSGAPLQPSRKPKQGEVVIQVEDFPGMAHVRPHWPHFPKKTPTATPAPQPRPTVAGQNQPESDPELPHPPTSPYEGSHPPTGPSPPKEPKTPSGETPTNPPERTYPIPKEPKEPKTPTTEGPRNPPTPTDPVPKEPKTPTTDGPRNPPTPTDPVPKEPKTPNTDGPRNPPTPTDPVPKEPKTPTTDGPRNPPTPTDPVPKEPKTPTTDGPNTPPTPTYPEPKEPKTPEVEVPTNPPTCPEYPNCPGTPSTYSAAPAQVVPNNKPAVAVAPPGHARPQPHTTVTPTSAPTFVGADSNTNDDEEPIEVFEHPPFNPTPYQAGKPPKPTDYVAN